MLEQLAKQYIKEAQFGKKESALFYLGAMSRAIDKLECRRRRHYRSPFGDKFYIKSEFENDIRSLYSQAVLKLAEYDIEEDLAWAMKGFLDNYTDEIEDLTVDEKRFYILSGTAFYGTLGMYVDVDEWISSSEAIERWGLGASTVRQAIHEGRFVEGQDVRKSGGIWLVSTKAMERLYGEAKAVTVKQAWEILEKEAVSGNTPEYWAKIENGLIIVQRNYQAAKKHIAKLGGARELAPSPELEDTEWLGFNRDPESIIADNYI